jgi:hypothetical protein
MFSIGQANRDFSRPVEVLEAFEKFLASDTNASPETTAEARSAVAELREKLGRIRVECEMPGAEVRYCRPFTRFEVVGFCLIMALAATCSFDASRLRASAPRALDGAIEHPVGIDGAGAKSGGSTSLSDTGLGGRSGSAGQAGSGGITATDAPAEASPAPDAEVDVPAVPDATSVTDAPQVPDVLPDSDLAPMDTSTGGAAGDTGAGGAGGANGTSGAGGTGGAGGTSDTGGTSNTGGAGGVGGANGTSGAGGTGGAGGTSDTGGASNTGGAGGAGGASDPSLVGWWKLNDGLGTIASDSSRTGATGTLVDTPTWTTNVPTQPGPHPPYPTALHFDGVKDRVVLRNPTALNFSGQITIAAWTKLDTLDLALHDIVDHGYTRSPNADVSLNIQAGAYWIGTWTGGSGPTYGASTAVPNGDVGVWNHLAGTYDGTNWRLYRNGVVVASVPATVGAITVSTDWVIGGSAVAGDLRSFPGTIEDVRVYKRALSTTEIASLASGQ